MNKYKFQYIVILLPFINITGLFFWLYNCKKNNISTTILIKHIIISFLIVLPLIILQITADKLFDNIAVIIDYISIYLIPLLINLYLRKSARRKTRNPRTQVKTGDGSMS